MHLIVFLRPVWLRLLANLDRTCVGFCGCHSSAHVRIERKPDCAGKELSIAGFWQGRAVQGEIGQFGTPYRSLGQHIRFISLVIW